MKSAFEIPIFVVNLDESPERFKEIQVQLKEFSLKVERFSAVRGTKLSKQQLNQQYCSDANKKHFRRDLTLGEIGCYLSHRKIWQKMVDENIELAVVLEDDIFIQPNFVCIQTFAEQLKRYDLIKLADNRNYAPAAVKQLDQQHSLLSYKTIPNCTTGYAITLAGARKFLSREKICRPVDIDIQHCYELGVSVVGLKPYPVEENPKWDSDITKESGQRSSGKNSFWRNIKYRLRLAWYRKFYVSAKL